MKIPNTPASALEEWFPEVACFRDKQEAALNRVWAGGSCMVLMPTGVGKSLIYQLPVFASRGIGIVISPLIALMRQQADKLEAAGATVLSLGGEDAMSAQKSLKKFPWDKGPAFLFISPERAETDGYIEFLLRKHRDAITLIAVDEAHCISEWGDDFRPAYKALPGFLDRVFGPTEWPSLLCLTATLDEYDQREILSDFRLTSGDVIRSDNILRTNLDLGFHVYEDTPAKLDALDKLLDEHRGEKLIVYAHLKHNKERGTRALAERYSAQGFRCRPFDADLPTKDKDATLGDFADGTVEVVFATGAFGMGIDIPDIRGVVHFLLPGSLEQYYQEVGRAGRDGKPAFGALLHTKVNTKVRRDMIRAGTRSAEQIQQTWNDLFGSGRPGVKSISPWTQFQGQEDQHALFYAFQRTGALKVLARGPNRLKCFKAKSEEAKKFLEDLLKHTKTNLLAPAIKKQDKDIALAVQELYELYDSGELVLERSPDRTVFFERQDLTDAMIALLVDEISRKVEKRLKGFDEFVELIESEADPTEAVRKRLSHTA